MPVLEYEGVRLNYEVHGTGYPVLAFAPGGMRSVMDRWNQTPWDPVRELADRFKVIVMDQRNAGQSTAPVSATDGWDVYATDHQALLDHLEIERCHVLGGCIGGSYCLGLIQSAPARVTAAVLQQPIGLSDTNRALFYELFDGWASELGPIHPHMTTRAWAAFRENMYGGDFVFNVSREFVARCPVPLLVLMGNDPYHPTETSREIVRLAPQASLVEQWKEPEHVAPAVARVRQFLTETVPL